MKISVLVPIYGVERYIAQCAESLFLQTYDNIEYIFVNDCTKDCSVSVLEEVLERFPQRKPQVTILHHEENRGLGAARLTAIQAATGDYVMYVDSDDEVPVNAVALLAKQAETSGSDIVDGGYAMMCCGKLSGSYMPYKGSKMAFLKLLLCQNIVQSMVWARLYRRTLYTTYQIYPIEGIDYAEDLGLVPRLYFHASRSCIDAVVYHYRDDTAMSYTNVTMSDKAKRSFLLANALVQAFYHANDTARTFYYPLQLGYLNLLRVARRNNIPWSKVDSLCPCRLTSLPARLVAVVLRSRCPLSLASLLYLCLRKLYEVRVSLTSNH
jgi:glycosyltransferase involved in cell wall biosynthesis